MRKALSLVELIFTIVVIAIVFTVIPKIIFALNKSDSFAIRQDAMFNGISMMKMITNMPWDKNNTNSIAILNVSSNANQNFECNQTTHYRIGSFIGGRNCEDNLSANSIVSNFDNADNIGDFNATIVEANLSSTKKLYDLNITVSYIDDNTTVFKDDNTSVVIDLNDSTPVIYKTNLKKVELRVDYNGKRGKKRRLTQFNYVSTNIGLMILHKREW